VEVEPYHHVKLKNDDIVVIRATIPHPPHARPSSSGRVECRGIYHSALADFFRGVLERDAARMVAPFVVGVRVTGIRFLSVRRHRHRLPASPTHGSDALRVANQCASGWPLRHLGILDNWPGGTTIGIEHAQLKHVRNGHECDQKERASFLAKRRLRHTSLRRGLFAG
jgi:hypothetical protein